MFRARRKAAETSVVRLPLPRVRLVERALEQECVHERLRQVAAELALGDVELLRKQPRRAAGGAVALEPACGRDGVAAPAEGQRHDEAAQQERALRLAERAL